MPTTLPRHSVTETPDVADLLEAGRAKWPDDPPAKLLIHLAAEGVERIMRDPEVSRARRRRALENLSHTHPWPQSDDYIDRMRELDDVE